MRVMRIDSRNQMLNIRITIKQRASSRPSDITSRDRDLGLIPTDGYGHFGRISGRNIIICIQAKAFMYYCMKWTVILKCFQDKLPVRKGQIKSTFSILD